MISMMCRTRMIDYDVWKRVFDSHKEAHQTAGLTLVKLWRCTDEPNNVYFVFKVTDRPKAEAFLQSRASAEAGERAGVVDGEYHYVEEATGY